MAVRTNTLSGSTSTFHFAIYAIGTGDSTSFCGRIGIDWIWNRHPLLANPLEDIRNTRRIDSVYLRGVTLDRAALAAKWKR